MLSAAFLLTGNGLLGTLLPVRAQAESFSTLDIGVLGSCYFMGFAAGCYWGPYLVRRVGHIRAFAAIVSMTSILTLAYSLAAVPSVWWPVRALTGFCFAVLYMVIESWLSEKSTNENRGLVFSVYTVVHLTVITLGQMMLMLADPASFRLFALASILVSLAALPVALTTSPAPEPITAVHIRLGRLYRSSPVGFVCAVGVGLTNGSFWALAPVFAAANPLMTGTAGIALFMSTTVMAGALGQWPLGRLSDRVDRRKVIVGSAIVSATAGLAIGGFTKDATLATVLFPVVFGAFAFPLYSLCAAHMNDSVEAGGFVEASSGLLLLYAGGAMLGPLAASAAMGAVGPHGLFLYTSAVHAGIAAFTVHRMRQHGRPPEAEREPFVDSLITVQTVAPLDPLEPHPAETAPVDVSSESSPSSRPITP